jgi:hypothetical protein
MARLSSVTPSRRNTSGPTPFPQPSVQSRSPLMRIYSLGGTWSLCYPAILGRTPRQGPGESLSVTYFGNPFRSRREGPGETGIRRLQLYKELHGNDKVQGLPKVSRGLASMQGPVWAIFELPAVRLLEGFGKRARDSGTEASSGHLETPPGSLALPTSFNSNPPRASIAPYKLGQIYRISADVQPLYQNRFLPGGISF